MKHNIEGTVKHMKLEGGFWGIVDSKGRQWRPVKMPEQIKYDGYKVQVTLKEVEEDMSIFMWGTPVKVISFSTLTP
ncbi:MAG: hypothetical protein AAFO07_32800 [Bacteroidota bacterium]